MKKSIVSKGMFGYIGNRRCIVIVRTILYFAVCIGLYVMGYVTTGSNKNLLTVVAILGCLPSCKSLVNVIIFMRAKGCSEELHNKIKPFDDKLQGLYDLYFTSYQKNFDISHMIIKANVLCGITEQAKCDCNDAQRHLEQMIAQEGIKGITVKIFQDSSKYLERLQQLCKLEETDERQTEELRKLLFSISL